MPRDLLVRYKELTPAARLAEMRTMLQEVFNRLEEHGGASMNDLTLLASGLVRHCETRRTERKEEARKA